MGLQGTYGASLHLSSGGAARIWIQIGGVSQAALKERS
jgi:hypothetical protein